MLLVVAAGCGRGTTTPGGQRYAECLDSGLGPVTCDREFHNGTLPATRAEVIAHIRHTPVAALLHGDARARRYLGHGTLYSWSTELSYGQQRLLARVFLRRQRLGQYEPGLSATSVVRAMDLPDQRRANLDIVADDSIAFGLRAAISRFEWPRILTARHAIGLSPLGLRKLVGAPDSSARVGAVIVWYYGAHDQVALTFSRGAVVDQRD